VHGDFYATRFTGRACRAAASMAATRIMAGTGGVQKRAGRRCGESQDLHQNWMFTTIVNEVLAGSRRPEMAWNCRIPSARRGIFRASS